MTIKKLFILFTLISAFFNNCYAQKDENKNPKRMIITPVQLEVNNKVIQQRLDKIALGVFLKDQSFIPIISNTKELKNLGEGYEVFLFKVTGRKIYDLQLYIKNRDTGENVSTIKRSKIPHDKLYFIARMAIYELLYGKKYIQERLREIYDEAEKEDANILKNGFIPQEKKEKLAKLKKIKEKKAKKRKNRYARYRKRKKSKSKNSKRGGGANLSIPTVANFDFPEIDDDKEADSVKKQENKQADGTQSNSLGSQVSKTRTQIPRKSVALDEPLNFEPNFDLGYDATLSRKVENRERVSFNLGLTSTFGDVLSTDIVSTRFSAQFAGAKFEYIKFKRDSDGIEYFGEFQRPLNNANVDVGIESEQFTLPNYTNLGAKYYFYNQVFNIHGSLGGEVDNFYFFNLDTPNTGIQLGVSYVVWIDAGIRKEFQVFGFNTIAKFNYMFTFLDVTSYGNRDGALALGGSRIQLELATNVYKKFYLEGKYEMTSLSSSSVTNFTYQSILGSVGISYYF